MVVKIGRVPEKSIPHGKTLPVIILSLIGIVTNMMQIVVGEKI